MDGMTNIEVIGWLKATLVVCYTILWTTVGFASGCLYSIWCVQ